MLVTIAQYRLLTGDTATDSTTVSGAIVEAQSLVDEALERWLESAERTETLVIQAHGRVFPRAIPVTAIAALSPSAGEPMFGGFAVQVTTNPGPISLTELGEYDDQRYANSVVVETTAELLYTGGYTQVNVPATLRRGIARLARGIITAPTTGGTARPVGATSVSLGDASVSYAPSAGLASGAALVIDELVPGLFASLAPYRHPEAS